MGKNPESKEESNGVANRATPTTSRAVKRSKRSLDSPVIVRGIVKIKEGGPSSPVSHRLRSHPKKVRPEYSGDDQTDTEEVEILENDQD